MRALCLAKKQMLRRVLTSSALLLLDLHRSGHQLAPPSWKGEARFSSAMRERLRGLKQFGRRENHELIYNNNIISNHTVVCNMSRCHN